MNDNDPQAPQRAVPPTHRRTAPLTHVELTWIEKKIEHWLRFGRRAEEKIPVLCISRHRRPLQALMMTLYAPGSSMFDHGSRHERVADYFDLARQAIGSRGYDRAS